MYTHGCLWCRSPSGLTDWMFTTVRCWGELAVGTWTLTVQQNDGTGSLVNWRLTLHGSNMTTNEITERRKYVPHTVTPPSSHYHYCHTSLLTLSLLSHPLSHTHRAVVSAVSSGGETAIECPPHPDNLYPIIFVDHDRRNKVLAVDMCIK